MTPLLALAALLCGLMLAAACALMLTGTREARVASRLAAVRRHAGDDAAGQEKVALHLRTLAGLGNAASRRGLLPRKAVAEMGRMLAGAGFPGEQALALFIGGKILLLLALPVLTLLAAKLIAPDRMAPAAAAAAAVGLLAPDAYLRRRRGQRVKAVEKGLPDALDMLVICAEAGLPFEAGIERVARDVAYAHPAVAEELSVTASELRITSDRRAALVALGARLDVEFLQRLSATLVQAMQYGTPLTQALRVFSAEMRQEHLVRFEGQAARLPVLLTLPMLLFILPTVFLVVGGPAIIQILRFM